MASAFRRTTYQIISRKKILLPHSSRQKSTEANILKSVHKDFETQHQTIRDFAWHNLDRWPDKTLTVSTAIYFFYFIFTSVNENQYFLIKELISICLLTTKNTTYK